MLLVSKGVRGDIEKEYSEDRRVPSSVYNIENEGKCIVEKKKKDIFRYFNTAERRGDSDVEKKKN